MTGKKGHPRIRKVFFLIFSILIFVIMLAVTELNKDTVWGFILAAVLFVCFLLLHRSIAKGALPGKTWLWKLISWPAWIVLFFLILILTWPPVKTVPAAAQADPEKTGIISVAQGDLQGVVNEAGTVEIFAGIPYAKPPVGELRWREPQDPDSWEGVLQADHFAPMSMQPRNLPIYDSLKQIIGFHDYKLTLDDNWIPPVSEDSLYLNVWKPAGDVSGLPVLVFIHGGSLQTGQPWFGDYSGEGLAEDGVIVVNMAYRLGVFGYFADAELAAESEHGTTGNYGLLDQIKALEWVRENIAAFGGDPGNVTLAGESAGSASVSALCTSPLAKGLFRRAIMESSTTASIVPPHSFRTMEEALESGAEMKNRCGASAPADLRAIPAEKIAGEAEEQHHMTVDGYALTETPYESYRRGVHNEEAILHGYNSLESAAFILFDEANLGNYEAKVRDYFGEHSEEVFALYPITTDEEVRAYWAEIWGAVFFDYPHYCLNRLAADNGIPAYEYYFTKTNGRLGPWHSGEMIYCYGNIPEDSALFDARDRELSRQMQSYWVNFARTGDPNGAALPAAGDAGQGGNISSDAGDVRQAEGIPPAAESSAREETALPVWEENRSSSIVMEFGEKTEIISEREHELFRILDEMDGWP